MGCVDAWVVGGVWRDEVGGVVGEVGAWRVGVVWRDEVRRVVVVGCVEGRWGGCAGGCGVRT